MTVHGAAGVVFLEAHHLDHFIHNALTGQGRVAVDQDREQAVEVVGVEI